MVFPTDNTDTKIFIYFSLKGMKAAGRHSFQSGADNSILFGLQASCRPTRQAQPSGFNSPQNEKTPKANVKALGVDAPGTALVHIHP